MNRNKIFLLLFPQIIILFFYLMCIANVLYSLDIKFFFVMIFTQYM